MKKSFVKKVILLFVAVLLLLTSWSVYKRYEKLDKVSEFGKYQGYSEAVYDGSQRTSDYLTLADGTRLAYDLFLPTKDGVVADQPMPVLFKYICAGYLGHPSEFGR